MRVERVRVDAGFALVSPSPGARVAAGFALPAVAVEDALAERERRRHDGRAARRQADSLLAALASVQQAMLRGSEAEAVAALEALAAEPPPPADPPLAALLGEIRLRARVTAVQCRERWRATPWRVSNTSL